MPRTRWGKIPPGILTQGREWFLKNYWKHTDPVYHSWVKKCDFLSNFLLLTENYEPLAHETDPAEPKEDTDSVKYAKLAYLS